MNKATSTRTQSLVVVAGIYVLAIGFGSVTYFLLEWNNEIGKMLMADIAATIVVWLFGVILDNSSVYDPYWSVIPPLILGGWILSIRPERWEGIAALSLSVLVWAIRLTRNWFKGWADFTVQDWRYTMIRKTHPKLWLISNFFGINLMPTLIVFLQLAGAYAFISAAPRLNGWIIAGLFICLGSVFIQSLSDHQMDSFREKTRGQKKCIDEGLWRYSRHPNYFGEVSMWWGVWLMIFGGSGTFDWFIVAPILMTCLFLFISIPMMEKKILNSRPEYKKYQKTVSMLLPMPRRHPKPEEELPQTQE